MTLIYLTPFAFLFGLYFLTRFLLLKRYQDSTITLVLIGIIILGGVISAIYYKISIENIAEYSNPATEWQKLDILDNAALSVEYRSGIGVFAITEIGEKQLTKPIPYCLLESQTAEIPPEFVEIPDTPFADFPPPPQPFKQQIIFEMDYAVEYDALGLSSFVVLDNGEVWCSERVFRGPADLPNAIVFGIGILIIAVVVFMGSFLTLLVILIIALEIRQRRKVKNLEI